MMIRFFNVFKHFQMIIRFVNEYLFLSFGY